MFKKFDSSSMSGQSVVKSSSQRAITKTISEQYSRFPEELLEVVLPKKEQLIQVKCPDHVNLYASGQGKEILFFNQREGPFYPTLRLLHKVGDFMEKVHVDVGAIKPLLTGADLMCPGIRKEELGDFPANTPVQIMAEGKVLPFAIGLTKMSSQDIKETNAGVGVEIIHTLADGLWNTPDID